MAHEDPNELIRVEATDTKHQYTIARRSFEEAAHKIISEPAVDAGGNPLPPVFPEHKTSKSKPVSGN